MAKSYRFRAPRRTARRTRALRNKPLSAAHKRKISLAIKRRNRTGGSKKSKAVSRPARRSMAVARRSKPARRSVARRSSARRSVARRRGGGMRGVAARQAIGIKSLFSRDTLTIAGGAVGATMLSSYVLLNFRNVLPFAANPIGVAIYRTGIGLGGAMLAQRFNKSLAQGMLIGTAVMVINDALAYVLNMTNRAPAAVGAYYRTVGGSLSTNGRNMATPPTRGAGAIRPGQFTPGYQGSTQFGGALNNQSAFPSSAWGN